MEAVVLHREESHRGDGSMVRNSSQGHTQESKEAGRRVVTGGQMRQRPYNNQRSNQESASSRVQRQAESVKGIPRNTACTRVDTKENDQTIALTKTQTSFNGAHKRVRRVLGNTR